MDKLTISNLARGAVVEQFDFEFQKVLDNIMDPNTEAAKARKVQINIIVKPSKNRNTAAVQVQTKSSIIPAAPLETQIMMDRDAKGNVVAEEFGTGQLPGQVNMEDLVVDTNTGEILQDAKVINLKK